ncbi:glycosyltransferase family 2 protein [Leuconostoc suionicum]|nr:glycosyltransferase family 2 protein [Leuconostoc suionicum]
MTPISMSIVFYNNDISSVNKIVNNLVEVTSTFINKKIFLINNSPQNIELNSYLDLLSRSNESLVRITPKENKGFGAGHNSVLQYLSSDYHFVVNPDIYIQDANVFTTIVDYLEKNLDYGLLSPLIKYPNGETQHLLKKESTVFDMALRFVGLPIFKKRQESFISLPDGYNHTHDAENVPGSFMVFRTTVFKKVNGFDESYFLYMEDSDVTKAVNQVSKTVFLQNTVVYHEWQRENRKSVRGILTMLHSMGIYFNKWGWKLW